MFPSSFRSRTAQIGRRLQRKREGSSPAIAVLSSLRLCLKRQYQQLKPLRTVIQFQYASRAEVRILEVLAREAGRFLVTFDTC